jgi:hypothetical protein
VKEATLQHEACVVMVMVMVTMVVMVMLVIVNAVLSQQISDSR